MVRTRQTSKRAVALLSCALMLSGCAQHTWIPSSGINAGNFEPTKAVCSMEARSSGTGFAAYGSANFVAGAALGNAIGNSIRAQATFNDCMSARGWRVASPEVLAGIKDKQARIKEIGVASRDCLAATRGRDLYSPLTPYFVPISAGHFTMSQLAMDKLPTQAEAQLYIRYWDDVAPCFDRRQAQFEAISPEVASVFQQAQQRANANVLILVKRQQTFSAFFTEAERNAQVLATHLKTINL